MKTRITICICLICTIIVAVIPVSKLQSAPPIPPGFGKFQEDAEGPVEVTINPYSDTPSFVRGTIPWKLETIDGKIDLDLSARTFLARYADIFRINDAKSEFKVLGVQIDELGMTHINLQQVYQGIEVYNGEVKLHISQDSHAAVAISSGYVPGISLTAVEPQISTLQAVDIAKKLSPGSVPTNQPRLVVYAGVGSRISGQLARLAWLVEIRNENASQHNVYVIDAQSNALIDILPRQFEIDYGHQLSQVTHDRDTTDIRELEVLSDGQFPYGPNVQGFDIQAYLVSVHSSLSPYAELIDTRSHWYSINPRVLLTLLEMETGFVNNIPPTDWLRTPNPLLDKVDSIAESLLDSFYAILYQEDSSRAPTKLTTADGQIIQIGSEINAATLAVMSFFAGAFSLDKTLKYLDPDSPNGFILTYQRMFPENDPLDRSNIIDIHNTPPPGMLQLPFAIGDRWIFYQGPHDWASNNQGAPRAFIDIGLPGNGSVPNRWVAAAADGTVKRWSYDPRFGSEDCWVDIIHETGWATRYYHVSNLQVSTNMVVRRNSRLGNPSQLTCNGGVATAPHVHFGIMQPSGVFQRIHNTQLSGWRVIETGYMEGYLLGVSDNSRRNEGDDIQHRNICSNSVYQAEYFTNLTLNGEPVLVRCENPPLVNEWGTGGPALVVGNNNFSVRWTGNFPFIEGAYTFLARSDDGIRVWLDDDMIINGWREQPPTEYSAQRTLSSGNHQLRIEYYERAGDATAQVIWWTTNTDTDDNRTMTSGQSLWGTINPSADVDTYFFQGTQGHKVSVWMKKQIRQSLDSYLVLQAPNGSTIATDDDHGGDRNAWIDHVELPQTGRYQIQAKSHQSQSSGPYEIRLIVFQPGEPNRQTYDANHGTTLPGTLRRSEGQGPVNDRDIDRAHDFAGDTYRYYYSTFQRDSYDHLGSGIVSTVHYAQSFHNAIWTGTQVYYGDGFPTKDIVAHELTHGVTGSSARLEYRWQSGALNESFSDIFAVMVDRDDWLLGEDLPPTELGGRQALRDMSNPARFGQPAHVDDWESTCSDDEGVHSNSGIINKAFHNIAVAISKEKAERIFYRSLITYLHATSGLEDARSAALQSVRDLYGTGTEYTAVMNGFNAVGLDGYWQPPQNDCSCAVSQVISEFEGKTDPIAAMKTMATLYQVRDRLLSKDSTSWRYQQLYYQYTGRITALLLQEPELESTTFQILQSVTPGLDQLVKGRGHESTISADVVAAITSHLHNLARADRARGGGSLADTIETEMQSIHLDHLIGMSYADAWEYIQEQSAHISVK